jgi:hypothetical protein
MTLTGQDGRVMVGGAGRFFLISQKKNKPPKTKKIPKILGN